MFIEIIDENDNKELVNINYIVSICQWPPIQIGTKGNKAEIPRFGITTSNDQLIVAKGAYLRIKQIIDAKVMCKSELNEDGRVGIHFT